MSLFEHQYFTLINQIAAFWKRWKSHPIPSSLRTLIRWVQEAAVNIVMSHSRIPAILQTKVGWNCHYTRPTYVVHIIMFTQWNSSSNPLAAMSLIPVIFSCKLSNCLRTVFHRHHLVFVPWLEPSQVYISTRLLPWYSVLMILLINNAFRSSDPNFPFIL